MVNPAMPEYITGPCPNCPGLVTIIPNDIAYCNDCGSQWNWSN